MTICYASHHHDSVCCMDPPDIMLPVDDMKGFRELLRDSVEDFNFLLEKAAPHITKKDTHQRKAISPKDRLSVTLRFWQQTPTTELEWKAISKDFADKWNFPHCLGAVDGKHIFIQPPAKTGSLFYNYKSRFSIILMAVVDAQYRFVYASAGTQGKVSDAGVFAQSDLRDAMDAGLLHVPPDDTLPNTDVMMPYMFISEEAYPLKTNLMKPYRFRNLSTNQRIYNYCLSRARRVVENAQITTICLNPEKVVTILFVCLCLHNFLATRDLMPMYHLPMWIMRMPTISLLKGHGGERERYSLHQREEQEIPLWKPRSNETHFANTLFHLQEVFHGKRIWCSNCICYYNIELLCSKRKLCNQVG
ncbi:uncharacterized protein LOC127956013 isoform X2 [Carassius gibelio]|uniref:uncharacterized protein LOC127956013 isoform X2 n=1 Tax=Carassius gibelio TaxID=101364 RepID=UPI0022778FBD|nr:uncharacterized protein LOC127956013 isoform X2 [Carassius gibelio]